MVAAGEDPRFIARRLIISASEDVGNADPRALQVAVAAAQALDHVGLPEAQYALAQATIYLAVAPKSNRVGTAYGAAMADVTGRGSLPVPNHLKTAGDRRMKAHGIGVGYLYPHEYEGSDVAQQYLPDEIRDHRYYHPSAEGSERRIGELMEARQERRGSGKPTRAPQPPGSGMSGIGDGMKGHTEARKRLAETQRSDAS
jgi:putative ATPase